MSKMVNNYRVSVCLTRYYNDERSYCYICIDKRFKIVADLEDHFRKQFRLKNRFCLMIDKHLVPKEETIEIIREGEIVTIVPLNNDQWRENEPENVEVLQNGHIESGDIVDSPAIEKNGKKKKKKKAKLEIESGNGNEEEAVPEKKEKNILCENSETESSKKVDSDMDVSMGSEPEKEIEHKEEEKSADSEENLIDDFHDTDDSNQVPQKISDMQTAIQQLKQKALTLLGEVAIQKQVTGVSGGRINKRKRIRKRNKNSLSVSTPDLTEAVTPPVTFKPVAKASSHIRFDNEVSSQNTVRNSEIQSKPRIVHAVSSKPATIRRNSVSGTTNDAHNAVIVPEENHNSKVSPKKNPIITVEKVLKRLSEFPVMDNVHPVPTDLVMFKMLKMGTDYTPVISNHILGNVLTVDKATDNVKVLVVDGHDECRPVKGKFDFIDSEDNCEGEQILDVVWSQVTEPRVIFP